MSLGDIVYGLSTSRRLRNNPIPANGRVTQLGTSTTFNGTAPLPGATLPSARSTLAEGNIALGSPWDIVQLGYSGQNNAVLATKFSDVMATNPDMVVLQFAGNDLNDNTVAAAETAFTAVQTAAETYIRQGVAVAIQTPHYNGSNWTAALHYDALCQEWGAYMGIPVISGVYAISAGTDKTGTAKSGSMADTLHVNDVGARHYGAEWKAIIADGFTRRITPGGAAQVTTQCFLNPRMTGSTTASDTGFSGTKPVDWTLARSASAAGACTKGSDSLGDYLDISYTGTAANEFSTIIDANFATALAAAPANVKIRLVADYEIVTPGAIESVRFHVPFQSGRLQYPNGGSSDFSGVVTAGRRTLTSCLIDTALTGKTLFENTAGLRISFSGSGTSVIRVRGISCRESRW